MMHGQKNIKLNVRSLWSVQ